MTHRWCFVAGHHHDHRVVNPGLAPIGIAGVAQIMKPEVGNAGPLTGIGQGLLDLVEGLPLAGEDPIVIKISKLASLF